MDGGAAAGGGCGGGRVVVGVGNNITSQQLVSCK